MSENVEDIRQWWKERLDVIEDAYELDPWNSRDEEAAGLIRSFALHAAEELVIAGAPSDMVRHYLGKELRTVNEILAERGYDYRAATDTETLSRIVARAVESEVSNG